MYRRNWDCHIFYIGPIEKSECSRHASIHILHSSHCAANVAIKFVLLIDSRFGVFIHCTAAALLASFEANTPIYSARYSGQEIQASQQRQEAGAVY